MAEILRVVDTAILIDLSDGVGFLDCLIGASAYEHGVIIATLNEKHFRPFPNLQIERPY